MRSLEALVTDRQWEAGEERTGLIFEVPALVWGSLGVGGKCVELGAWRLRGQRCGAGQPRAWGLELAWGTCQGLHLTGLPIAESTQATDPTSAHILAAKRLSLSSPTSR